METVNLGAAFRLSSEKVVLCRAHWCGQGSQGLGRLGEEGGSRGTLL